MWRRRLAGTAVKMPSEAAGPIYLIGAATCFLGLSVWGASFGKEGFRSTLPVSLILAAIWPLVLIQLILAAGLGSALKKAIPDRDD